MGGEEAFVVSGNREVGKLWKGEEIVWEITGKGEKRETWSNALLERSYQCKIAFR